MAIRPTHTAFVVKDAADGSDRKAKWTEVGAIWPHKNGPGFDLVLLDQISVHGRIVCVERKDEPKDGPPDA